MYLYVFSPQLDGGHHFKKRHRFYHPAGVMSDSLKEVETTAEGISMVRVHWAAIWHDQMDFGFQWLTEMIDAASVSSGAARVIVPSTKEYHRRDSMYQLSKKVMYKVLGVNLTLVAGQWGLVPNWPTHFPHLWKSTLKLPSLEEQTRMYDLMRRCYPSRSNKPLEQIEAALEEATAASPTGDVDADMDIEMVSNIVEDFDVAEYVAGINATEGSAGFAVEGLEDDDEEDEDSRLSLRYEDGGMIDLAYDDDSDFDVLWADGDEDALDMEHDAFDEWQHSMEEQQEEISFDAMAYST